MKRALVAAVACAAWLAGAQAQAPAPAAPAATPGVANFDELRQQIRADRRSLVEHNLQLTPKEAAKFWPLYDKYMQDLDRVLRRQNRALNDYVSSEASLTEANAKRIAREFLSAEEDEHALRQKQMKAVAKVLPAKKAIRYVQIENKIRAIQRYDLSEVMPLVR